MTLRWSCIVQFGKETPLRFLQGLLGLTVDVIVKDVSPGKAVDILRVEELGIGVFGHAKILVGIPIQKGDLQHLIFVLKVSDTRFGRGLGVLLEIGGEGFRGDADEEMVTLDDLGALLLRFLGPLVPFLKLVRMPFLDQVAVGGFQLLQVNRTLDVKKFLELVDPLH